MGPFSEPSELTVGSAGASAYGDAAGGAGADAGAVDPALFHPVIPHPESAPGLDLAAQEVWFVALISFLSVVLLVGFVAIVCIRQRHLHEKSVGHYNGQFSMFWGIKWLKLLDNGCLKVETMPSLLLLTI